MKKLLILGMSLNVGGAEKSLVNLLNMIDYSQYDVDLLLFQKKGAFLKQIPSEVNLIDDGCIRILFQSASETLHSEKINMHVLKLIFIRYIATLVNRIKWKQFDQIRLHRWMGWYKKVISCNKINYDVAVAYAGGDTAYYMIDKVQAERKVYFFHSDYSEIDIDANLERYYVDQADTIVTISEVCKLSLDRLFPEKKADIIVLSNLTSPKLIWSLSDEYIPNEFEIDENIIKIVSVGRLNPIKGFDMSVEAAYMLKNKKYKFRWVIVGEGDERKNLEDKIRQYHLENDFILVGLKENPYPYILKADVLLQTSRFEGKSVVLDEARILRKPAIITKYNSAHDQINDGVDGLIVEMNAEAIANGIIRCIENAELLEQWKENIFIDDSLQDVEGYLQCLMTGINH